MLALKSEILFWPNQLRLLLGPWPYQWNESLHSSCFFFFVWGIVQQETIFMSIWYLVVASN